MRLVDADALLNDICESLNQMTNIGIAVDGEWLWGKLNDALDNAPTIEPQRIKGKWINNCRCSVCGYSDKNYSDAPNNFCPVCGADMRGEE